MGEFDLIKTYFAPLAGPEGLELVDDAACLTPKAGFDLVLTKDTMVEGVHFPHASNPELIARRLMRVNLSDLAAKGAVPRGYLLSIAWPNSLGGAVLNDQARMFASGLKAEQDRFDFKLYGGDTVSTLGPMVVSATFIGHVPKGAMVTRSGAQPGDDVWLTGTLGQACLGLKVIEDDTAVADIDPQVKVRWQQAYYCPEPRLDMMKILRTKATASADISDGLLADLGHIGRASALAMDISLESIPLRTDVRQWVSGQQDETLLQLITFGDDYEIAFIAHPEDADAIRTHARSLAFPLTHIGVCRSGAGVNLLRENGDKVDIERPGFSHF